ncbi:hypothetical protein FPV67DRAFT_769889 [Lyophyllum atratum]|nr:hypothetical protein FPV67DRAFT_769889 [Lyophyllum atratum]
MPQDSTAILNSIVQAYNLQLTRRCIEQPHPANGMLYIAMVTVDNISYQATDGSRSRAKELADRDAVLALERRGFQIPRRHYRTEINNFGHQHRMEVRYHDECIGPPHRCMWLTTVYVGDVRAGWAQSRDKGTAREEAAKLAVEYFESRNYRF